MNRYVKLGVLTLKRVFGYKIFSITKHLNTDLVLE
jgi:hypothetical protein